MPVPAQDRYQPACLGDEVLAFRILSILEGGGGGEPDGKAQENMSVLQWCKIECYGTLNEKALGEFRKSLVEKKLQLRCNDHMEGKDILFLYIMYNGCSNMRKEENSGRKNSLCKMLIVILKYRFIVCSKSILMFVNVHIEI